MWLTTPQRMTPSPFYKLNTPEIKLICHTENWGYAGGYNKAMAQIDADLICLMNNDIRTTPHWLNAIIEAFAANGRMALAQPKILDLNHPTHFEYAGAAGGMMDRFGYPYCRGRIFDTIEEDSDQYASAQVFWASGACLFVRKSVFESLGGFDDSFFAHMEEIDLCWRAQHQGHEVWALCNSSVLHLGRWHFNIWQFEKNTIKFSKQPFYACQKHRQAFAVYPNYKAVTRRNSSMAFYVQGTNFTLWRHIYGTHGLLSWCPFLFYEKK